MLRPWPSPIQAWKCSPAGLGPAGTPDAILDSLHEAIETINRQPAVVKALADASSEPMHARAQMAAAIENEPDP
jgi:hypothetical protein